MTLYPKIHIRCETKNLHTGEHCPEEGTKEICENVFLCERCYKTWLQIKSKGKNLQSESEKVKINIKTIKRTYEMDKIKR